MNAEHNTVSPVDLRAIRRSRRRPAITQFDYLHSPRSLPGSRDAFAHLPGPVADVLDVWCGSRPYDDLLPPGPAASASTSRATLTVSPTSFRTRSCRSTTRRSTSSCASSRSTTGVPAHAVAEIARVLRPGGSALVSSVVGFEYDRRHFEARYTEHELRALFAGWDDVRVREDGGRVCRGPC